jgi:hypothetical protein
MVQRRNLVEVAVKTNKYGDLRQPFAQAAHHFGKTTVEQQYAAVKPIERVLKVVRGIARIRRNPRDACAMQAERALEGDGIIE